MSRWGCEMANGKEFAKPLVAPNVLHDWLYDASNGDKIPYFIGHLAYERQYNADLNLVGQIAAAASDNGCACLTQSRHEKGFIYLITKARRA